MNETLYPTRLGGSMRRLALCLCLLALSAGGLTVLGSCITDETALLGISADTWVLLLKYLCSFLTLFVIFAGFGAAEYYLAYGHGRAAAGAMGIALGAYFVSLLIAAFLSAHPYAAYGGDVWAAQFALQLGTALLNILLFALLCYAVLLLVYLLFFRNRRRPDLALRTFSHRDPLCRAGIVTAALVLVYQLVGQIIDTLSFVEEYWPNIYQNEIVSIVVDYLLLVGSVFLGYLIRHVVQLFLFTTYTEEEL